MRVTGLAALTAIAIAASPTARADHAAIPHGDVRAFTISASSVGGRARTVRVYLPSGYATAPDSARYPVVYLLHGWPGSDGNWLGMGHAAETLDTLIAAHHIPETIAVFPDGRGSGLLGRSLYVDGHDGRLRIEQFVAYDLVAWADSTFRTRATADARAILGLSDGGTGALRLAMLHPDVFGACASTSGTFRLRSEPGMGGVLGAGAEADRRRDAASPALLAAANAPTMRAQTIAFDCGLDDDALGDNRAFDRLLDSLGVPHVYREHPGGHGWGYWRARLPALLEQVTARMPR